jgi:hypothetical protein
MINKYLQQSIFAIYACTILVSCGETGHLTRRYKTVVYNNDIPEDTLKKNVQISGFVFDPESKPLAPKSIFDLSPQGQKELIKALASKDTKPDLLAKLASPLSNSKDGPSLIVDHTKFTRRLVFAVIDLSSNQADRITKANIILAVENPIKVVSFDKIITKYESVDLGKLNFSNTTNLGISASAGAGADVGDTSTTASVPASAGFGYGINANASNSRVFSEEVNLKQRFVALSGYVTPKSLNLYEESTSGVDLTGNIITEVTFQYVGAEAVRATYQFSNLYDKNNKESKPDSVKVSEQYQVYPDVNDDISVTFNFGATIRKVIKGDRTTSESDDEIVLKSGTTTTGQSILLVPKKLLVPKFWTVTANDRKLYIKSPLSDQPGILFFASLDDAEAFTFWLKKKSKDLNNGWLAGHQYHLTLDNGDLSEIFVDNCQPHAENPAKAKKP